MSFCEQSEHSAANNSSFNYRLEMGNKSVRLCGPCYSWCMCICQFWTGFELFHMFSTPKLHRYTVSILLPILALGLYSINDTKNSNAQFKCKRSCMFAHFHIPWWSETCNRQCMEKNWFKGWLESRVIVLHMARCRMTQAVFESYVKAVSWTGNNCNMPLRYEWERVNLIV